MLWQALTAVRDIGRLHDIASILIRYGFGDMVRRMGMANALERAGRALHWNEAEELAHLDPPARVRRAMEALGPTFVKLLYLGFEFRASCFKNNYGGFDRNSGCPQSYC